MTLDKKVITFKNIDNVACVHTKAPSRLDFAYQPGVVPRTQVFAVLVVLYLVAGGTCGLSRKPEGGVLLMV